MFPFRHHLFNHILIRERASSLEVSVVLVSSTGDDEFSSSTVSVVVVVSEASATSASGVVESTAVVSGPSEVSSAVEEISIAVEVSTSVVSEDVDGKVVASSPVDDPSVLDDVSPSSDLVTFFPGCSQVPNLSFLFSLVHCLLQQAASTRHSPSSGTQTQPRVVQLNEQQ